jgi:D-tyrosyl-tRNA(Tyr) deacylase
MAGMRAVLQRVTHAAVTVDDEIVGAIDRPGLLALIGVSVDDDSAAADRMATKIWGLRILEGERSASDLDAPILVISQFTLYADTAKGRRPSWNAAARGDLAEPLVQHVVDALRRHGAHVATGAFGAHMQVTLVNDGPVTLILDA